MQYKQVIKELNDIHEIYLDYGKIKRSVLTKYGYPNKINELLIEGHKIVIELINYYYRYAYIMLDDGFTIEDIKLENPKTKEIALIINNISLDGTALLVISSKDDAVKRAARNLPGITVVKNDQLTAWNVLKYRYLIINQTSLSELKAKFSKS